MGGQRGRRQRGDREPARAEPRGPRARAPQLYQEVRRQEGAPPLSLSLPASRVRSLTLAFPHPASQFFKASTAVRKWAEGEYQPIDFYDRESGALVRKAVAATL